MISKEIRDQLTKDGYDNVVLYDNQSYDYSLIGVDEDGRAVYDYELMVSELADEFFEENPECKDYDDARLDAEDWIGVNTIRATPYESFGPVILSYNEYEECWINCVNLEPYDTSKIMYYTKKGETLKDIYENNNQI